MYLSALSGSMHNIFEFGAARLATSTAIANVEPPETPVMIPYFFASSLAQ